MNRPTESAQEERQRQPRINLGFFSVLLISLVGGAILRSAIVTRQDGFTIDEAYHIGAGVSYVRHADFRINPEHPPLVKLWVGSLISATGFHQSSLRAFADKADERNFVEEDVYHSNDFTSVQRRARVAMWTFNGLLLVALGFALRGAFGPGVALGTLLFLAIDPTIAAHLPVVMTDLPVSLLSATAIILAVRAFQRWAWTDLAVCSLALGLALATKHSAPVFFLFVIVTGGVRALDLPVSQLDNPRLYRFAKLLAVAIGALIVLWGSYFFRFSESKSGDEVFNRPLAQKISDVHSPAYRFVLSKMASTHVVPRAYIWGFADTIRAGLEGRAEPIRAFGRSYINKGPRYFFPAMIALKLPIGLSALLLIGLFLFFARRLPFERSAKWNVTLCAVLAALLLFSFVLVMGSTYGGIRHALPVVVLLAIFAGVAMHAAFASKSNALKSVVVTAIVAAVASALPVMRPWEYFNEFIGGTENGYLYFSDEGVDLWQRGTEMAAYYRQVLEPAVEVPLHAYGIFEPEMRARRMDWLGRDPQRDAARLNSPVFSGTVLINGRFLGKWPFWDAAALRKTAPSARFGNLFVFRGTCDCGPVLAPGIYFEAQSKIYAEKPDYQEAERLLKKSIAFDPSAFFVHIVLGNLLVKRGARDEAVQSYLQALRYAPADPEERRLIEEQIKRISSEPLDRIPELRDPFME